MFGWIEWLWLRTAGTSSKNDSKAKSGLGIELRSLKKFDLDKS